MLKLVMTGYYNNTEIFIYENFLTEEQSEHLINVVEFQPKASWSTDKVEDKEGNYSDFWDGKSILIQNCEGLDVNVVIDIETRARLIYEQIYPELMNKVSYSYVDAINRFSVGDHMPVHSDRGPHPTNKDVIHGFVIYLNDNYEGGEIHYPNKQISIKPKKYSLIVHPGSDEYQHGVMPVTKGHRYALTMFVHETVDK